MSGDEQKIWGVFGRPRNRDEMRDARNRGHTLPCTFPTFISEHATHDEAAAELERLELVGVGFIWPVDIQPANSQRGSQS